MVDVVDIHDATWEKHVEYVQKQNEETPQPQDPTTGNVKEAAPVNPPLPSSASIPMTGPSAEEIVSEELPSVASKV